MQRQHAIERLSAAEPAIRACGVGALHIFGSVARDDANEASDLDVFVDPSSSIFYDLANYMGAFEALRRAVPGMRVGFSTRNGISPAIREAVEREAVKVF